MKPPGGGGRSFLCVILYFVGRSFPISTFKDEKFRLEARDLLMRSRLYQLFALTAAVVGLIIFAFLYFENIDGRFDEALRDPATLVMVVMPFLPAIVLSIMAERARTRFIDMLQRIEPGTPPADKKKK